MNLKALIAPLFLSAVVSTAQVTVTTFEGIDASTDPLSVYRVDPNGAVGTKQYLEWVDQAYQGFDKVTGAQIWTQTQKASTPFVQNNLTDCETSGGNGVILFDHLALRWIIGVRVGSPPPNGKGYFYCVAVSNTDDLTASNFAWYTYEVALDPILTVGSLVGYPDYPRLATWPDAYYATFDLQNPSSGFRTVGVAVCALDRNHMLTGAVANPAQCFRYPQMPNNVNFLQHTLLPADIDGTTPPPTGTVESFVSIQNPTGTNTSSTQLNLWQMHVDWNTPANTTFTGPTPITVAAYTPGCYIVSSPTNTYCVPEPSSSTTHDYIDSVGDRLMHRFAFRQFPNYQSYLVSQSVAVNSTRQTGIRWYELEPSGSTMTVANYGTISPDNKYFRFVPSLAQDKVGNVAIGYSGSSSALHPSIAGSYLNLPSNSNPTEFLILMGSADVENTSFWGGYTSMTVDPVDDCTFWYVNEYLTTNQAGSTRTWRTRLANFKLRGCQ